MALERLQKILAAAGVASRRKAEEMITAGQVTVNGTVVTELGTKADLESDHIRVDGKLLQGAERPVYIMLHKPKGHVTTVTDPEGRPTVLDLVKGIPQRVFPVGRLDYLSEGLLLLTNDGELMQKLTHASSHVPKTYVVKIAGVPAEEDLDRLRAGIVLPPEPSRAGTFGGTLPGMKRRSETVKTQPCEIELVKEQDNPWYKVTLVEGRNRQIRRMFEQIRHHVEKIKRVRYGSLELDVEPGEFRFLTPAEVGKLRVSANKPYKIAPPKPRLAKRAFKRDESLTDVRDRAAAPPRAFKPREGGLSDRKRRAENRNTRESGATAGRQESGFKREGFAPREERAPRREGGYRPREERPGKPSFGARGGLDQKEGARSRTGQFKPREDRPRPGTRERAGTTGGYDRPKRAGFGAKREGFKPREGGFRPREDRGERPPRANAGHAGGERSPAGFDRPKRPSFGAKREGFTPRERSGGFGAKREGFKTREGGFKPLEDRGERAPREGTGGSERPSAGYDRPKRPSFGAKREGFKPRERTGGFGAKREGFKPREGGFKPREDRGERTPREGAGRSERPSAGYDRPKRPSFGAKREGFAPRERTGGFGAKREGFTPRERTGSDFKKRSNSRGPGSSPGSSPRPPRRGTGRPPKKDQG